MKHLILADGHFVGAPGEATRWRRLLDKANDQGVAELSVLGDFFELWIGLEGQQEPWHAEFFAPLYALKLTGVRLRYVVGNKDYFVERWNRQHGLFDEVHQTGCIVDSALGPLHLAHGDLVNHRDHQYRLWRSFSRSWAAALLMRAMPAKMLRAVAARMARQLKVTNRYHKSYFPESELRARARELTAGAATLIYGHFHRHSDMTEGDKRIITLPFLGGETAGILLDESGFSLFDDT